MPGAGAYAQLFVPMPRSLLSMDRSPLAVVGLAVAALVSPVSAASAACDDGVRVTQMREKGSVVVRSTVRICRDGRERVARQATMRLRARPVNRAAVPRSGTLLTSADIRAGRLAIGAVRAEHGRRIVEVELRALRDRRLLFRRARRTRPGAPPMAGPDAVLTADGDLAWNEPSFNLRSLFVRRTSGAVERVPTTSDTYQLAVEDGRTLRWGSGYFYEFFDVRPVPGRECPDRRRFRPVAEIGRIVITRADYVVRAEKAYVLRACLREAGRDVVLGGGVSISDDSGDTVVVLAREPYVVVLRTFGTKYETVPSTLRRFDLRTGVDDVLDRGALTDVRAEGDTVRWRRDGADRSADVQRQP